jgi:hypothetical protein
MCQRQLHPFIEGLLQTLPEPGTLWTIEGRAAWLKAAALIFTLMYHDEGDINVQVAAGSGDPAALVGSCDLPDGDPGLLR